MLQSPIIGQNEQPFAVSVQASRRINAGQGNKFFQRGMFAVATELGDDTVGLVEQDKSAHEKYDTRCIGDAPEKYHRMGRKLAA